MRIIVTGGAGFVGTNLVKRLMVEGHEVTSLDNYSTGKKENEQQGCKYITGDIDDIYLRKIESRRAENSTKERASNSSAQLDLNLINSSVEELGQEHA